MKNKFIATVLTVAVAATLLVGTNPTPQTAVTLPTQANPVPARMLFPLYITPGVNGANWKAVADANTYKNIDVILNPYNGPSTSINANYVNGIAMLRAAAVGICGYVHSTYGARPIADVKVDIDRWLSWYAPDCIFVDEAEYRPLSGDEPYYSELYSYIKSRGMQVINNPGTGTTETYANLADSTCIVESNVTKTLTLPAWAWNYPPSKFCYLAHSASVEQMRVAADTAKRNNIGRIFITNATANYWSSIPPYLAEEAAILAGSTVIPATSTPTQAPNTPTVTLTATPVLPTVTKTQTATPTRTPTPRPEVCFTLIPTVVIDGLGRGQMCFK